MEKQGFGVRGRNRGLWKYRRKLVRGKSHLFCVLRHGEELVREEKRQRVVQPLKKGTTHLYSSFLLLYGAGVRP